MNQKGEGGPVQRRRSLKGAERIEIDRRYCKGCMLCQYVCKFEVFEPGAGTKRSRLSHAPGGESGKLPGLPALRGPLSGHGPDRGRQKERRGKK